MIFESHAHYDDEAFDEDREELLESLKENGVGTIINVGASLDSCEKTVNLAEKYDYIYAAVGVHPSDVADLNEENFAWLEGLTKKDKVVAIGEIGLDYYWDDVPRDIQKKWFIKQLELANEVDLPVIIHDREAHADTLELVKKYRPKGIIHCFSGSAETAKEFLRLGMYIGFTGSVTFKNANKILLAAEVVPEDRILLETDSPYMAPVPYRGQRCDSSLIPATAERLAEIRGTDAQTLINKAFENGCRIYGINAEELK